MWVLFFVLYTAIWDKYKVELGVIVNHFALAEHLKCIVPRAMQKEETLILFLASAGVILQPVHQILSVFSSQLLRCLQTFLLLPHFFVPASSKNWIRSCNCLNQESLRRKRFIIKFNIAFFFFSWSQLVKSGLTTTLPMTDQNSGVQTL